MKSENIKAYRLIVIAFFITISILIYFNIKYLKQLELNKSYNRASATFKSNSIKAYGYSEALHVLAKVPQINIISYNDLADKKLLKVEIKYDGNIDGFTKTINELKKEDNYYNIDNIKLENINTSKQLIKFNLFLVNNK